MWLCCLLMQRFVRFLCLMNVFVDGLRCRLGGVGGVRGDLVVVYLKVGCWLIVITAF